MFIFMFCEMSYLKQDYHICPSLGLISVNGYINEKIILHHLFKLANIFIFIVSLAYSNPNLT